MGLLKNSPQAFLPFLCPGQVFSSNYRVAMAVISLQRRLRAGMSALKQIMTLRKERLFKIFCLMSLTALAGAWCGTSLLMGRLCGKNAPQGRPAAVLSSLWNTPDVWKGQAGEMQQLRDEVTHLAAEIRSIKKEAQQMREAMSDPIEVPGWSLKSTGTAIDLQKSSSTSARLRRVFSSLFSQPFEDTFVQGLDEKGQDETLLGSFIYNMHKQPTQSFPLQNSIPRAFRLLKLGIQSNWGKSGYTCIYRVQVHGKMAETNVIGKTHVETFPR
ncbi:uncharacterized protein AAGF69_016144 [Amazona ochrocephala]